LQYSLHIHFAYLCGTVSRVCGFVEMAKVTNERAERHVDINLVAITAKESSLSSPFRDPRVNLGRPIRRKLWSDDLAKLGLRVEDDRERQHVVVWPRTSIREIFEWRVEF
jgi:hypothetical protein